MSNRVIEAVLRLSSKLGSMRAFDQTAAKMDMVNRKAKAFNRTNSIMAKSVSASYVAAARHIGPALAAFTGSQGFVRFAEIERSMNRIGITAGASAEKTAAALGKVQQVAMDTAMPVDAIVAGLDSMVASGLNLDEALAFLPSVAAAAQASGAEVLDIALSADAVSRNLGITAGKMGNAFDIMAAAGKMGKFELKDMAQYLPSLAPAFKRVGYEGEYGLKRLVSILQVMRSQTGSASQAATNLSNILNKMTSEETVKKFSKMGVKNLREELEKTRQAGGDVIERFLELTNIAVKGDLSKLPLLFTDAEYLQGMNALMTSPEMAQKLMEALGNVDGTVLADLGRILDDNKSKIEKMKTSWDGFVTAFGGAVATPVGGILDTLSDKMAYNSAVNAGLEQSGVNGFLDRSIWGVSNDQAAKDGMAWRGGYRSDEQKKLIDAYGKFGADRTSGGNRTPTFDARIGPGGVPYPATYGSANSDMPPIVVRRSAPNASVAPTGPDPSLSAVDKIDAKILSGVESGVEKLKLGFDHGASGAGDEIEGSFYQGGDVLAAAIAEALRVGGMSLGDSIRQSVQGITVNVVGNQPDRTKGGQSDARPMPRANVGKSTAGRAGGPR